MGLRRVLFAGGLLAAACVNSPGWAAERAAAAASPAVLDAKAWLVKVHRAASLRNYQGTQVVSAGGAISSSRVAHFCAGAHQYERVDMLDGQTRRVLRHNDTVYTVWPQRRLAVVEQRDALSPFPALLQADGESLAEHYELLAQGADRQAGYEADVYLLKPRDRLRFAQRLWAERGTGLLLRADVLGLRGEVLESSAFSEVAIGVKPQPQQILQPLKQLEGYRLVRPVVSATQLESEGWALGHPVSGFRQVSCVRRSLLPAAFEGAGAPQQQALQAVFSDGLTHVSLFIEPFDAQRHQRGMASSMGATHTLMQRQGDWWVTVVGDVPPSTLKQFAAALQRRAPR